VFASTLITGAISCDVLISVHILLTSLLSITECRVLSAELDFTDAVNGSVVAVTV
jgi:hypothetical protein